MLCETTEAQQDFEPALRLDGCGPYDRARARSVGYHLYKAYPKLGITRRAQLDLQHQSSD